MLEFPTTGGPNKTQHTTTLIIGTPNMGPLFFGNRHFGIFVCLLLRCLDGQSQGVYEARYNQALLGGLPVSSAHPSRTVTYSNMFWDFGIGGILVLRGCMHTQFEVPGSQKPRRLPVGSPQKTPSK